MAQQVTTDNSLEEWRIKYNQFVVEYGDFYSSITGVAGGIYVNRSGDSMSGKLTIDRTTSNDALEIKTNDGVDGHLYFRRGSVFVSKISSKFYGTDINSSQVTSFSINTVEVARISATGHLGIGTSNPQRGIHLRGSPGSAIPSIRYERTGVRSWSSEVTSTGEFQLLDNTAGLVRMFTSSSGNFGFGTISIGDFGTDVRVIDAQGSAGSVVRTRGTNVDAIIQSSDASSSGIIGTRSNHNLSIISNNTERLRIRSDGINEFRSTNANDVLRIVNTSTSTGVGVFSSMRFVTPSISWSIGAEDSNNFFVYDNVTAALNLQMTGGANANFTAFTRGSGLFNVRNGNTSRFEIYSNNQVFFVGAGIDNSTVLRTTDAARQVDIRFTHGASVATNFIGSAGAAGQLVNDSGAYDLVFRTNATNFRWSVNNGTSSSMVLNSAGQLTLFSDRIRVSTSRTPASATAAGAQGDICWDADYIYICVATNTWKRAALSTW